MDSLSILTVPIWLLIKDVVTTISAYMYKRKIWAQTLYYAVVVGIRHFLAENRSLIVTHEPIKLDFEISEMMIKFGDDKTPQQSIYIKV